MELLTAELRAAMPKLYSTEEIPLDEKVIAAKFFTPDSNWTWYAVEGQQDKSDYLFFGLVDGFEKEWGYFSLRELESLRGPLGLPVERDLHFSGKKIKDVK